MVDHLQQLLILLVVGAYLWCTFAFGRRLRELDAATHAKVFRRSLMGLPNAGDAAIMLAFVLSRKHRRYGDRRLSWLSDATLVLFLVFTAGMIGTFVVLFSGR